MTISADRRGWGPGWPTNNAKKCVVVRARRSGTQLMVRREIAPIVQFLLDETEDRGYLFDHGPKDPLDDWGFANRPIGDTYIPSNHSWGLAVDLDATLYPQGQRKRRLPQWVEDLWRKYGFDNGVYWANPDPMHMEFGGTPRDAAFYVNSLAAHAIEGTRPPVPPSVISPPRTPINPPTGNPAITTSEEDDMRLVTLKYDAPRATEKWLYVGSVLAPNNVLVPGCAINVSTKKPAELEALAGQNPAQGLVVGDEQCNTQKFYWHEISTDQWHEAQNRPTGWTPVG